MTQITSPSFPQGLEGLRSEADVRAAQAPLGLSMVDVIRAGAQPRSHRGMSDDALNDERTAQNWLREAIVDLEHALKLLERVNRDSSLVKVNVSAFRDVMADELPSMLGWDEKIGEARDG